MQARPFERLGQASGCLPRGLCATMTGMPRIRATSCTDCHGQAADVGQISWRGLCTACATARVAAWHAGGWQLTAEQQRRWQESRGPAGRPPRGRGVSPT